MHSVAASAWASPLGVHLGPSYTVAGAEAIGYEEVAAELRRVTGREVRFMDVPP